MNDFSIALLFAHVARVFSEILAGFLFYLAYKLYRLGVFEKTEDDKALCLDRRTGLGGHTLNDQAGGSYDTIFIVAGKHHFVLEFLGSPKPLLGA